MRRDFIAIVSSRQAMYRPVPSFGSYRSIHIIEASPE